MKELDYQFRNQEERQEERDRQRELRSEEYYKKMDELLRKKSRAGALTLGKASKKKEEKAKSDKMGGASGNIMNIQVAGKKTKKKRHSIF